MFCVAVSVGLVSAIYDGVGFIFISRLRGRIRVCQYVIFFNGQLVCTFALFNILCECFLSQPLCTTLNTGRLRWQYNANSRVN